MSENDTIKGLAKNTMGCTLGLAMFGVGVYLTIQANIGVYPWDVLIIGLSKSTGIIYGNISILINVALILIDLFLLQEKIGLGSVIDALIIGKVVDLLNWLDVLPTMNGNIAVRIIIFLVGISIEGFSQYFYMKAALCAGPKDTLFIGLSRRLPKLSIGTVNALLLLTVMAVGWLLGGPVGIGTIIAPFGMGLMQNLTFKVMHFNPKNVKHQSITATWKVIIASVKA